MVGGINREIVDGIDGLVNKLLDRWMAEELKDEYLDLYTLPGNRRWLLSYLGLPCRTALNV